MTEPADSNAGQRSPPAADATLGFVRSTGALVSQQALGQATGIIDFHSAGRVLVIDANQRALALAEQLSGLTPTFLILDPTAAALDKQLTDTGLSVFTAARVRVNGYLGAFDIQAGPGSSGSELTNLGVAVFSESGCFDLVLDLCVEAQVPPTLKPLGYFHAPDAQSLAAALLALPGMVGDFEKPRYFEYRADWCAHSRSELTGCSRCIDACAAGAIRAQGERIEVDPYLCQGCGSCATTCPSGAITYAYPRVGDAIERTRSLLDEQADKTVLLLHDEKARQSVERASLPASWLALEVEEVTAYGLDYWASMLCRGVERVVLVLNDPLASSDRSVGPAQPADPGLTAIDQQRELLHRLLGALALGGEVVVRTTPESLAALAKLPVSLAGSNLPGKSRFATHGDKRATVRAALDTLAAINAPQQAVLALEGSAPFGRIGVDVDACTLCMACVSTCPAGALLDGQDKPALRLIEANCVQCGLCEKACPERAISLQPQYTWDSVKARQIDTLHEEPAFHCVACHQPFATVSMISTMLDKLSGHWMFQDDKALQRLKMCEDCRVKDLFDERPEGMDVHRESGKN